MIVKKTTERFHRLPLFARYIASERMDDFVKHLVHLSTNEDSLLLMTLTTEKEQFHKRATVSAARMLGYFQTSQMECYVNDSLRQWANNEVEQVDKFAISADDIIAINGIRQAALLEFSPAFESNRQHLVKLNQEIVDFFLQFNRKAFQFYDEILKQRLNSSEDQLLEAQELARVGSFTATKNF
jgi:hypothetical protein